MQNKIITVLLTFSIFFSSILFSQTPSSRPKFDKLFPHAAPPDTNKIVTSSIQSSQQTRPVADNKLLPQSKLHAVITTPPPDTTTKVTTAIITTPPPDTTIKVATAAIVAPPPVQPKPQVVKPAPKPVFNDMRLGSSTPQYDTWQKNNNGAGSVTTSPK